MDPLAPLTAATPKPTANRPLLGLTILVIEDSRFAGEAIRLMCLRSGARIRRADCLRSARRHLQVYRPTVALVDIGLPDGTGTDLIAELAAARPRVEALLAMSGDIHLETDALAAGADAFLSKPMSNIAHFQERILSALPAERRPNGLRKLDVSDVAPDPVALLDDLAHIADVLDDPPDELALDYAAQFLSGVAKAAQDEKLEEAALALAAKRAMGQGTASETAVLAGIIQQRLTDRVAI